MSPEYCTWFWNDTKIGVYYVQVPLVNIWGQWSKILTFRVVALLLTFIISRQLLNNLKSFFLILLNFYLMVLLLFDCFSLIHICKCLYCSYLKACIDLYSFFRWCFVCPHCTCISNVYSIQQKFCHFFHNIQRWKCGKCSCIKLHWKGITFVSNGCILDF